LKSRLPTCTPDEQSRRLAGEYPFEKAPAVMIGFHVEPGASWPWKARESRGVPAAEE
jgi:hypothetical protein